MSAIRVSRFVVHSSTHGATFEVTVERGNAWLGQPPLTDVPQDVQDALRSWLTVTEASGE